MESDIPCMQACLQHEWLFGNIKRGRDLPKFQKLGLFSHLQPNFIHLVASYRPIEPPIMKTSIIVLLASLASQACAVPTLYLAGDSTMAPGGGGSGTQGSFSYSNP